MSMAFITSVIGPPSDVAVALAKQWSLALPRFFAPKRRVTVR
jgi:hypothetical protein